MTNSVVANSEKSDHSESSSSDHEETCPNNNNNNNRKKKCCSRSGKSRRKNSNSEKPWWVEMLEKQQKEREIAAVKYMTDITNPHPPKIAVPVPFTVQTPIEIPVPVYIPRTCHRQKIPYEDLVKHGRKRHQSRRRGYRNDDIIERYGEESDHEGGDSWLLFVAVTITILFFLYCFKRSLVR